MKYSMLYNFLKEENYNFLQNEPLKKHTTFKTGGPCNFFVEVENRQKLCNLIKFLNDFNIPRFIIGQGSNLLFSDYGFNGAILKLTGDFEKIILTSENIINCAAGVSIANLCKFALNASLSGLEFAWGIPGNLGGAVFMNAGAYGGEFKDIILDVIFLDENLNEKNLESDLLSFGYRKSKFSNTKEIILSANIKLEKSSKEQIEQKMNEFLSRRKLKQPLEFPSAGSTFKRPVGNFAGTLIEKCGLRGKTIGGAMVSTKHTGFIINYDNATSQDILDLISFVRETVFKKTGIMLEPEIKIINSRI